MQIIGNIFLMCGCILVLQTNDCKMKNTKSKDPQYSMQTINDKRVENENGSPQVVYRVLTKECLYPNCLVFVYVEKTEFSEKNIRRLANMFADKYKNKDKVTVFFFDDFKLAEAHTQGKREPLDLEQTAKALFLRNSKEEYLKMRVSNKESENWSSWEMVFNKVL